MKERGILMSGMNIAPLRADIKTHTRRAMKNPPSVMGFRHWHARQWERLDGNGRVLDMINCKYGEVGDRLWVKETWAWPGEEHLIYRANSHDAAMVEKWKGNPNFPQVKWRPSIFMPRWASRILLEITEIRVERLQDISEADAIAEGVESIGYTGERAGPNRYSVRVDGLWLSAPTAAGAYAMLWETINGAGSWDENPFVWVIIFRRIEQ